MKGQFHSTLQILIQAPTDCLKHLPIPMLHAEKISQLYLRDHQILRNLLQGQSIISHQARFQVDALYFLMLPFQNVLHHLLSSITIHRTHRIAQQQLRHVQPFYRSSLVFSLQKIDALLRNRHPCHSRAIKSHTLSVAQHLWILE